MIEFELDQDKINEILGEYELDHATEAQRTAVAELVSTLHEFTNIPTGTMMGFVYISALSWEQKYGKKINVIEGYTPEEREKAVFEMRDNLKFMMRGVLVKPGQWKQLEEGIDTAYERYEEKWKHR
ncbi:MAG: hypothetical protein ACXAE3_15150 [Candidatus Kariarchaeaceae archaeon]|jgi:hypothetical protein